MNTNNMKSYFDGTRLYGDDFDLNQINAWFEEEKEGYAELGSKKKESYRYPYHSMNSHYGYKRIPNDKVFNNALGIGSAYGEEFLPVITRIKNLTIVEPSDQLKSHRLGNIIPKYLKPNIDGTLNFENNFFDLINSLSVLHHIPNVSYTVSELVRVLAPGGYLLIREPILTMGDWRMPRAGLTRNERGIPVKVFDKIIEDSNLEVVSKAYCDCAFAYKILGNMGLIKRDTVQYQKLDEIFGKMFSWNYTYHRINPFQKIAPSSLFFVLYKPKN